MGREAELLLIVGGGGLVGGLMLYGLAAWICGRFIAHRGRRTLVALGVSVGASALLGVLSGGLGFALLFGVFPAFLLVLASLPPAGSRVE